MTTLDTIAEELRSLREEVRALKTPQPMRPELTTAEAVAYSGHRSLSAFYRWCAARKVKAIAHGRYRKAALDRAMGA